MSPSSPEFPLTGLQPAIVWKHFATLCSMPRPSKGEAALRDALRAWALGCGLSASVDAAGNLLVRKPATFGQQGAPGVILQGHLDMVCQKQPDSAHDFSRDPVAPLLRDGWLVAEQTTLGADNGIGVALILAALEDDTLVHGPLEALLTVDEEAGMGGARGLPSGVLDGRLMLNLDTEDWGDFYLGCAGGLDVEVRRPAIPEPAPAAHRFVRIVLGGLRGGHSGVNIDEERGNAIKLLVRALQQLASRTPFRLAALAGGSARNALPREAAATLALPLANVGFDAWLAEVTDELRAELAGVDEGLTLRAEACADSPVMAAAEQARWLSALHAAPHGVRRMSRRVPGVVETSNNLGIVDLRPDGGYAHFMVRSLVDRAGVALADEIVSLFGLADIRAVQSGFYPGWTPDPGSPLLAVCQSVYRREFGGESRVRVVHAGLECGIIGEKYPGLDIVSFGPTIRGAHAPGERVEVAAVERCWHLLTAILAELAGEGR